MSAPKPTPPRTAATPIRGSIAERADLVIRWSSTGDGFTRMTADVLSALPDTTKRTARMVTR